MAKKLIIISVLLLIAIAVYLSIVLYKPEAVQVRQTVFKIKVRIENTSSEVISNPKIYLFAPLENTPFQRIISTQIGLPYQFIEREGASYIELSPDYLAPYASKDVVITYLMEFPNTHFEDVDFWDQHGYSLIEPLQNIPEQFDELLVWINKRISYMGYVPEVLGSDYALREGKGDCTEFALTFSRLAASQERQVTTVDGFAVLSGSSKLRLSDYHSWSYVNDRGRPLLVDAQNNLVAPDLSKYLVMSFISEPVKGKSQLKRRFFTDDKRLKLSIR